VKISIVVPAHNESENISGLIDKIEASVDLPHELIVVDDHSSDNTQSLIRQACKRHKNVRLVENKLSGGFANALRAGFASASCEAVVPVMGDLCDDLGTVKPMLEKINEGYDIVCGSRYMRGGRRMGGSRLKAFLSGVGGSSLYYLLGIPTHDISNAFKMYRKSVLDSVKPDSTGFEISMEIPLKAHCMGFKITEVPTSWKEREKGKSNFKVFKLLPRYIKLYLWAIFKRKG